MRTNPLHPTLAAAVAVAAALSLTVAPGASAKPLGRRGGIYDFADSHLARSASNIALSLASPANAGKVEQLCAPRRAHRMSLSAALASAQQFVARHGGRRGTTKLDRSAQGRSERKAIAGAAGALAANRPVAALAALLRAHQLARRDPVALIDAAPVLVRAGLPDEAVAFLSAAKRLHPPRMLPFGLKGSAVLATNDGYALLALGQWSAAAKQLQGAVRQAPLLREAKLDLAQAYLCAKQTDKAAQEMFLAAGRQSFPPDELVGSGTGTGTGESGSLRVASPPEIFDLSRGVTATAPTLVYPPVSGGADAIRQGMALRDSYRSLVAAQTGVESALGSQQTALSAKLTAAEQRMSPLTRQRTQDIIAAIGNSGGDPDIEAYQKPIEAELSEQKSYEIQIYANRECAEAGTLHAGYWQAVLAEDTTIRQLIAAQYRRDTGLAANLSDPLAHQLALVDAQVHAEFTYDELLNSVNEAGNYDYEQYVGCQLGPPPGDQPAQTAPAQQPGVPACPSDLQGAFFEINLIVAKLKVTCEQVKLSVSGGDWITPFASLSHNFATGSTTIFAGAQGGPKGALGTFGGGAKVQDGLYLTVGADGSARDFGFRVGAGANVSAGDFAVGDATQMDFSFVGVSPIAVLTGGI